MILFISFSLSLIVMGLGLAWRNVVAKKLIGEFLIINFLYVFYLLTIIILNYIKFYQSFENAFWQTTEVWSLGIAAIAVFGWRIPFLTFLFLREQLTRQTRLVLGIGFTASILSLLFSYVFFQETETFEIITAAGPLLFFICSIGYSLISGNHKLPKEYALRYRSLLLLPLLLMLVSITIDTILYISTITLYPFSMMIFQLSVLILIKCSNMDKPLDDIDRFVEELARSHGTSRRENELIALLLQGLSKKEIAQRLFISPNTVKTHTANIYRKVRISSRNELFVLYYSQKPTIHPKGES